jgi:hypothetical protein
MWICLTLMVVIGAAVLLPLVNGLLAGLAGGRFAASRGQAMRAAGLASLALAATAGPVLLAFAPRVAPHWIAATVVMLLAGAWIAGAERDALARGARS